MTDQDQQTTTNRQPQELKIDKPNDAEKYSAFAGGAGLMLTGCLVVGALVPILGFVVNVFQLLSCGIGFYFGIKGRRQARLEQTSQFTSTLGIILAVVNLSIVVVPWLLVALAFMIHAK